MSNDKLKPCPFCGEVPRRMNEDKLAHIVMHSVTLETPVCPCSGKNFAIKAWNTRHEQ